MWQQCGDVACPVGGRPCPDVFQICVGFVTVEFVGQRAATRRTIRVWLELESEGGSTSPEGCDAALALLFLIALLPLVDEGFAAREHEVQPCGQACGRPRYWRAACPCVSTAGGRTRRAPSRCATGSWLPFSAPAGRGWRRVVCRKPASSTSVRGGAQAQPRTEVLDAGKAAQIRADLGEDRHHGGHGQAVDARQAHARPARERGTRVEPGAFFWRFLSGPASWTS